MSVSEIINIILVIASVVLGIFECRSQIKSIIANAANEAINAAEDRNLIGEEKMQKAIDFVFTKIPAIFKPFITKDSIRKVIQAVFDKIESFIETQAYKK